MSEETAKLLWEVMGATVRGASHVRADSANQDCIDWWRKDQASPVVCLAVSDGHGSSKSFRSDLGSKFAVEIALNVLQKFADDVRSSPDSWIKDRAQEKLPRVVVNQWSEKVKEHINEQSFTPEEKKKLGAAAPEVAYGATLVTVLVSESYILYLQLGDGDILTVSESGQVTRPLEADKRLFANETTSLCLPKAWDDFRFGFQRLSDRPPALILVSTDGYSNSFRDEDSFKKVGSDILTMMYKPGGVAAVKGSIEEWLQIATTKGSGDDISLGIIYREPPSRLSSLSDEVTEVVGDEQSGPLERRVDDKAVDPNAPASDKLRSILRSGVLEDRIRREGMLSDMFSEKGQISVLAASLKHRIPQSLGSRPEVVVESRISELIDRLKRNAGLSEENAHWAVRLWAEALGLVPSAPALDGPPGRPPEIQSPAEVGNQDLGSAIQPMGPAGVDEPEKSTESQQFTVPPPDDSADKAPIQPMAGGEPTPDEKQNAGAGAAASDERPDVLRGPSPQLSPAVDPRHDELRSSDPSFLGRFRFWMKRFSSGAVEQVVAADGSAQFRTIGEAISTARPKTRILVRPGLYNESLELRKPLEIIGQGAVNEIVIESSDAPSLLIKATYAVAKGLTLRCRARSGGKGSHAVDASVGKVHLEDCTIRSESRSCLAIHGMTDVSLLRCDLSAAKESGVLIFDDGVGRFDKCHIHENSLEGVHVRQGRVVLKGCKIRKNGYEAVRVDVGYADVESCDLSGNARGAWKAHPQHATVSERGNRED